MVHLSILSGGFTWSRPAIAFAGLCLSVVTARRGLRRSAMAGCAPGKDCEALAAGRWGRWCGLPVSVPAAVAYGVALLASLCVAAGAPRAMAPAATLVLLGLAPLFAGSAAWFLVLQFAALRRVCPYCLAAHVVSLALAAATAADPVLWERLGAARLSVHLPLWAGAAALAALVLGQLLLPSREYEVRIITGPNAGGEARYTGDDAGLGAVRGAAGASPGDVHAGCAGACQAGEEVPDVAASNPFTGSLVVAGRGRFLLPGGRWPTLGSPGARTSVVMLFEHTCDACRRLHRLLSQRAAADAALMLVAVPVAPDASAAPVGKAPGGRGADAAAYARLALTVWRADWRAYEALNQFLCTGTDVPDLAEAQRRAAVLLGCTVARLTGLAAAPPIDALLAEGVRLFRRVGATRLPILLLPHGVSCGSVPTERQLTAVLSQLGAAPAVPNRVAVPGTGQWGPVRA